MIGLFQTLFVELRETMNARSALPGRGSDWGTRVAGCEQELYRWESVAEAARRALGMRYRLLPYLYTAFAHSSESGAPVARPLFFEYPGDWSARGVQGQWMLGADLLVSPVLYEVPPPPPHPILHIFLLILDNISGMDKR